MVVTLEKSSKAPFASIILSFSPIKTSIFIPFLFSELCWKEGFSNYFQEPLSFKGRITSQGSFPRSFPVFKDYGVGRVHYLDWGYWPTNFGKVFGNYRFSLIPGFTIIWSWGLGLNFGFGVWARKAGEEGEVGGLSYCGSGGLVEGVTSNWLWNLVSI